MLQKLLEGGSFSKLYSYMLKRIEGSKKNIIEGSDGIWIKYDRGSEPDELVKSLEGKGTGWCTAGIKTARTKLQGGNFHVYYTKDSTGEYKQPRIAIRMQGDSIGEIRGINKHQNLEPEMEEILDKKLEEFSDRGKYKKKVSDMEKLTTIYKEYKNRELTIEELRFVYEIDNKIEGFGYSKDPRIEEILYERNFKKDISKICNCSEDEVSDDKNDILSGKKIVYFYGRLYFKNLISFEGCLTLPPNMLGDLSLPRLKSAEGLVLPNNIVGDLNLRSLTSADGLTLPSSVGGNLDLRHLVSAKDLTLPNNIGGFLDLGCLKSTDGLIVPKDFKCGGLISFYITMEDLIYKSLENKDEVIRQK